jgi:hypothetical protein
MTDKQEPESVQNAQQVLSSQFKTAASTLTQFLFASQREARNTYQAGYEQALREVMQHLRETLHENSKEQTIEWCKEKLGKPQKKSSQPLDVSRLSQSLPKLNSSPIHVPSRSMVNQSDDLKRVPTDDSLKRRHESSEEIFAMDNPTEAFQFLTGSFHLHGPPLKKFKDDE